MSYPGIFQSILILGALGSGVNSARTRSRDKVRHYANEKRNQAYIASPTAPRQVKGWLYEEGLR